MLKTLLKLQIFTEKVNEALAKIQSSDKLLIKISIKDSLSLEKKYLL